MTRSTRAIAMAATVVIAGGSTAIALVATHNSRHNRAAQPQSPTPSPPSSLAKPMPTPFRAAKTPVVSWAPLAYDGTPAAVPGTVAHPNRTPWCTSEQLSALKATFQGATGSAAGSVGVRNVGSSACAVQGVPTLTGYSGSGQVIATARPMDTFQLHPWLVLPPHATAFALVQIFGDESRCVGPISRLAMDIGHGQPAITVPPSWVDGSGVQPRCGSDKPSRLRDTYDISVRDWRHRNGGPRLDGWDAGANVTQLPATVQQGGILHYRVQLTGLPTVPCLPFRERLVGERGVTLAEQTFLLACDSIERASIGIGDPVVLAMRLAIPTTAAPGDAELSWTLPVGVSADVPSSVKLLAAPPPCTQAQLRITGGRQGAGLGSFYAPILFRNVSTTACSLRGYPGVEYVAADGTAMPTRPSQDTAIPVRTVVLPPGKTASAMLSGGDFGPNGGATPCPETAGVRIIAPGLTTQVFLPDITLNCNDGNIFVTTVQRGSRPQP